MQTWYKVMGDYGPQAGDNYLFYILTSRGEEAAREMFAARMARDLPGMWDRMGMNNVDVVASFPQENNARTQNAE